MATMKSPNELNQKDTANSFQNLQKLLQLNNRIVKIALLNEEKRVF